MSQDSDIEMLKARVGQLEGLVQTLMTKYGGISDPSRMVAGGQTYLPLNIINAAGFGTVLIETEPGQAGLIIVFDAVGNNTIQLNGDVGRVRGISLTAQSGVNENDFLATSHATATAGAGVLPAAPVGFVDCIVAGGNGRIPYYNP